MKAILVQIIIGLACGFLFGFFSLVSIVNSKDKDMRFVWSELRNSLRDRYIKLRSVLSAIKTHLPDLEKQISDLDSVLENAIDTEYTLEQVNQAILLENKINKNLEDIKFYMKKNAALNEDPVVQEAVDAVIESETVVGLAIGFYNEAQLEYTSFLEIFPISSVADFMGKKAELFIPFSVSQVQEFDENYYIDEDEINV